MKTLSEA
jgi:translation factor GUF1, mitochondrial